MFVVAFLLIFWDVDKLLSTFVVVLIWDIDRLILALVVVFWDVYRLAQAFIIVIIVFFFTISTGTY